MELVILLCTTHVCKASKCFFEIRPVVCDFVNNVLSVSLKFSKSGYWCSEFAFVLLRFNDAWCGYGI